MPNMQQPAAGADFCKLRRLRAEGASAIKRQMAGVCPVRLLPRRSLMEGAMYKIIKLMPKCGATHCPGCVNCGRGMSDR